MGIVSSDKLIDFDFIHLGTPFIVLSNDSIIQTNGLDYLDQFDLISIVQLQYPELEFTFLNNISIDIDEEFEFKNGLTESIELQETIRNKLVSLNEIEKSFIFNNILDKDLVENYNGFLFNKLHGV